jgi:protein translocase SecG subunit
MAKTIISVSQIVLAALMIAVILLQSRGTGLGTAWGGTGASFHSKRGFEKILFLATVVVAALFLLLSIVNVIIT